MMGTLDVKHKACHKNTDPNFNLEAKKPVSHTITPLLPATLGAKVTGSFRAYATKSRGI
jgi:hypothetical protein